MEPEASSYHANRYNFVYELHRARKLKLSDDRDRVFAFLGHYALSLLHDLFLLQLRINGALGSLFKPEMNLVGVVSLSDSNLGPANAKFPLHPAQKGCLD